MNPTQLPHPTDFEAVAKSLAMQLANANLTIAVLSDQVQQSLDAQQAAEPEPAEVPTPGVV